jgi:hypothetical protein
MNHKPGLPSVALFLAIFATPIPSHAQHACIRGLGMENAQKWWTGGKNAKYLMDFTADAPRLSSDEIGQTRSIETTAVYTTAEGELLLYTDGDFVFDGQTHQEIGRGVGGNPSSTEAALIVPAPGGDPTNDFYVFGNTASTSGKINFTRVDIRAASIDEVQELDGGLIFGESLGTVPHANGVDFWILSVANRDPTLNAYLITSEGVSTNAVRSSLPDLPESATANRGSIVYHPPTGRLALTLYSAGSRHSLMYTAAFDEMTGVASSFERFELGGYGVAFSPDGTKLYFSKGYSGAFWQLDRSTGETHQLAGGSWAMPRLAPDGKIYVVGYNRSSMGVVENPDEAFESLTWNPTAVELPEGARTAYSLPNQVYAPCSVNYPAASPSAEGYLSVAVEEGGEIIDDSSPESIEIVLDMSGSMWGQIEGRAKYEIAREIVAATVKELPIEVDVGVRVYSHRSGDCRDSELLGSIGRQDREVLVEKIASLKPGKGKTPIGYSLEQVADDLRGLEGSKAILLVSDGLETCGGDPVAAAHALCAAGVDIQVHTVAFDVGSETEAVEQLKQVAAAGCGQFFLAEGAIELRQALGSAGQMTFTLTDLDTGETWTESVGSAPLRLTGGTYRLTVQAQSPVDLGTVEITPGSTTTVLLARTPEGVRRSDSH